MIKGLTEIAEICKENEEDENLARISFLALRMLRKIKDDAGAGSPFITEMALIDQRSDWNYDIFGGLRMRMNYWFYESAQMMLEYHTDDHPRKREPDDSMFFVIPPEETRGLAEYLAAVVLGRGKGIPAGYVSENLLMKSLEVISEVAKSLGGIDEE